MGKKLLQWWYAGIITMIDYFHTPKETMDLRWFPHNIRAIMAKIKLPKKPLSMVIFWIKVRRSYRDLALKLTRERKLNLKLSIFQLKERFALAENKITLAFSILTKFDSKFLENAWGFHRGVTWRTELQWDVLNGIQEVTVLWVDFSYILFARTLSGIRLNISMIF